MVETGSLELTGRDRLGLRVCTMSTPSGELAYVDEGAGPVIVLLHGAPFTSLAYVRVIRRLRDRFRVIAPDLPGFGRSRAAPAFDGSLAAHARAVQQLLEALDLQQLVLFVCDASGSIGLRAATCMTSRVRGVVIADTVPLPLTGRAWLVKMALRHLVGSRVVRWLNRKLNILPWAVATVDPLRHRFCASERAVLIGEFDTAAKRDRIIDMFVSMGYDDGFMRDTQAAVSAHLRDMPVLLMFGQLDPVRFVGAISRYQRLLPRCTVSIIAGEKHFPFLGGGYEVARVLADWMQALHTKTETPRP